MINKPLSEILRPQTLDEFVGQEHLIGKNGPVRMVIEKGNLFSMIFWGPPGTGKTTLARIIANELDYRFVEISPVTSGIKDIKALVAEVSPQGDQIRMVDKATILFVDEIHRFNKAQQDYLLPHVENGTLTIIGATTENPSFEVISPLLSRTKVYVFERLNDKDIQKLLKKCIEYIEENDEIKPKPKINKEAQELLVQLSNGDARNLLNSIDAILKTEIKKVNKENLEGILQTKYLQYDKKGEEHYNLISAYIKSMRASDANAAIYYLARMIEAGEDPKFIARRMVIFASEDIGIADSKALMVANDVFRACETIGYPECGINLAHGTVYLAKTKKSRTANDALQNALRDVHETGNLEIPMNLRNAPTKLMKDLGYGKGYEKYPKDQSLLPEELKGKKYFR